MKEELSKQLASLIENANHAIDELHEFVIESQSETMEIYKKYMTPTTTLLYHMNTVDMIHRRELNDKKTDNPTC